MKNLAVPFALFIMLGMLVGIACGQEDSSTASEPSAATVSSARTSSSSVSSSSSPSSSSLSPPVSSSSSESSSPCSPLSASSVRPPVHCGPNERPVQCRPCDGTCQNPNPICPLICIENCRGFCACEPNYVRNNYGRCIPKRECQHQPGEECCFFHHCKRCPPNERCVQVGPFPYIKVCAPRYPPPPHYPEPRPPHYGVQPMPNDEQ